MSNFSTSPHCHSLVDKPGWPRKSASSTRTQQQPSSFEDRSHAVAMLKNNGNNGMTFVDDVKLASNAI
ncbi:unnamed protein product [Onchocerca flexuosa]|uniref:Uncharacterized protein n=1 Tax=Onchocerca flexuosa TaxID=387005 RepID=A0A183HYV1_9BILA|nr:unnamed protein product [Onchocerca flexuosa]